MLNCWVTDTNDTLYSNLVADALGGDPPVRTGQRTRARSGSVEGIVIAERSHATDPQPLALGGGDSALCRLALAWIFVPSSATVPSLSSPISRANSSTRTNSASMSLRKRRRNVAMVSWSGCWFTAMNRNATEIIGRPLQLAARKHPGRIAVNQQLQQQDRMIASRTGAPIALHHRRQVQPVDHLHNKPRQVLLGKPFIERRRKQKSRLAIKLAEIAHRWASRRRINCATIRRVAYNPLSPTGCSHVRCQELRRRISSPACGKQIKSKQARTAGGRD